jgi:Domain of unknown function (DUF4390)
MWRFRNNFFCEQSLGGRGWPALLWLLLLVSFAALSADDEELELRSVYTGSNNGIYELHANLILKLPEGAQQAIRDGAPLNLTLEILVRRNRRFWTDETLATLEQRYEVMYHSLSERYVVRNVNSGAQDSFQTLDAALGSLAMINGLPILDTSLVPPQGMNEVSVRANVEIRNIPRALSILLFWVNNWQQTSDWYTWTLRP